MLNWKHAHAQMKAYTCSTESMCSPKIMQMLMCKHEHAHLKHAPAPKSMRMHMLTWKLKFAHVH